MNWSAIGAIGQILGSLATFATVGYLVVQVHDTEIKMKRSIAQNRVDRQIQLNMPLITDERLAGLHMKLNDSLRGESPLPPFMEAATKQFGLTREQAFSLYVEQITRWQGLLLTIAYIDELPPGERVSFDKNNRSAVFGEPLFRFWYNPTKPVLNQEGVRYIDNLLAQPG
jgi:hypothetical protein